MYLDFFGLEREPFHITPDPEFLFPSPSHKEAFATVMYGVQQQKGFVVVTGEVGTGKTTILRAYLQKLKGSDIQPIYVFDPHLEFDELLEAILTELGAPPDAGTTQFARLQWLRHYLIDAYSAGRSVVLIIDEAQNMPVGTLEQLRVLTNLETTKDKLLQVLLVGQPELEEKLALHQLRQLNQRVAVRATLRALGTEEATDYVKHRIRQAGGTPETVFTPTALKAIVNSAKGNPRVLNITCDNVLINAFGAQESPVSARIVRDVVRTVLPGPKSKAVPWKQYAPLAAAGVLLLVGGSVLFMVRPPAETAAPVAPAPVEAKNPEPVPAESSSPAEVPAPPEVVPDPAFDTNQLALKRMLERERAVEAAAGIRSEAKPVAEPESPEPPVTEKAPEQEPVETVARPVAQNELAAAETQSEVKAETVVAEVPAKAEEAPPVETVEEKPAVAEATPAPPETAAVPAPVQEPNRPVELKAVPVKAKPEPAAKSEPKPEPVAAPKPVAEPERPVETVVASAEPVPVEATTPVVAVAPAGEAVTALVEQPPAEQAGVGGLVAREVVKGDKLIVLLEKVYGRSDAEIIELVQRANPGLTDPNRILAGEDLVFPVLEEIAEPAAVGEPTPAPAN